MVWGHKAWGTLEVMWILKMSFVPLYNTIILYCSLKSKFDCLLVCLWQMINSVIIVTVVVVCAKKVTTDLFCVRVLWAASWTLCCTPQVVTPMPTPITSLNWTASTWSPSTTAGRPPSGPTTWTRASGNNPLAPTATSQMQQPQPSRLLHLKPSSHSRSTAFKIVYAFLRHTGCVTVSVCAHHADMESPDETDDDDDFLYW